MSAGQSKQEEWREEKPGGPPRDLGERETRQFRLRDKCDLGFAMIRDDGLARWASRARSRP